MVRIAPVRLTFNPKTLWFDAGEFDFCVDTPVIVETARGTEFGRVAQPFFEATDEQVEDLRSPLKPVLREAFEEDVERAEELLQYGRDALPLFRQIAAETIPEMNPISVEYLFDGDKAVFYFEAEDRVDFRELVRKLAAEFHVRIDMKQIGVRDEARMIGGLGHCGQELCCKRLGGDFDTVSIRMAKEQDLSLNPQKISGLCGRLMCCLRYEYDAYKDFHGRAPKKGAKINTPEGPGKVVDLDVPREIISIKVGDDKPVKIPLADMEPPTEGKRPDTVGEEAWEIAHEETQSTLYGTDNLLTSQLFAEDRLADRTRVAHVGGGSLPTSDSSEEEPSRRSRSRRRASQKVSAPEPAPIEHKTRRRRSTKVEADGSTTVEKVAPEERKNETLKSAEAPEQKSSSSRRRRRHRGSGSQGATEEANTAQSAEKQPTQGKTRAGGPGRKSSNLRASKQHDAAAQGADGAPKPEGSGNRRRRRRSHKSSSSGEGAPANEGE